MYPIRINFTGVLGRIQQLRNDGHSAESLVTSVFTLEKLMKRSMRLAILSRGFTSKHADHLLLRKGFSDLKEIWVVFDPQHRKLPEVIGQRMWQDIPHAVEMRNALVHGNKVYKLELCDQYAGYVVATLTSLHTKVSVDFGRDPWVKLPSRTKSKLSWFE